MKTITNLTLLLTLLLTTGLFAQGTVRYVSPNGSSTPPYTSWETASDSIQKCIDISSFGDTIYVGNGTYEETITFRKGINLIGSGVDSCIIDTRELVEPIDYYSVTIRDSSRIKNFSIKVSNDRSGVGIATYVSGIKKGIFLENLLITNASTCLLLSNTNAKISNCIFSNSLIGVRLGDGNIRQIFLDNVFINLFSGINISIGSKPTIKNNIFYHCDEAYSGGGSYEVNILNNLVIGDNSSSDEGFALSLVPTNVRNNLITGIKGRTGIFGGENNSIKNNHIQNSKYGIEDGTNNGAEISYNNMWNNEQNYYNADPDSTNISVFPMFAKDEPEGEYDYHLQKYSPLIDAGDPSIFDKDSSRSDIGLYGGPFGENYQYQDLPPNIPVIKSVILDSGNVHINWKANHETDFKAYILYRDTTQNFTITENKVIAKLDTTSYTEPVVNADAVYYKLTAVDNQGNQTEPSGEQGLVLVGVNNRRGIAKEFKLMQNYPNPFNSTTNIGFKVIKPSRVRIAVYDITGSLVEEIMNEFKQPGYYEINYDLKDPKTLDNLAAGIYLYRMEVKSRNNVPLFTDIKKMVYLK